MSIPKQHKSKIIENILKKDKNAVDVPILIGRLFKWFIFKKVPQKDPIGRCIKCDATNLCGIAFDCKCKLDQQYQRRWR